MTVERDIIDALEAATGVETFLGMAPQPADDTPAPLPVNIVNRVRTDWVNTFCGVDGAFNITGIQVDYYADTAEQSRRNADTGRASLIALAMGATLDTEVSYYDIVSRGWRIQQQWNFAEYEPSLP